MMLTRLFLNAHSRDVQRALGDSHALHSRVMSMFPVVDAAAPRASLGVLHRLDSSDGGAVLQLLVQSKARPDATKLPAGFLDPAAGADAVSSTDLAPVLAAIQPGARFRFRLRANPTRKIDTKTGPDGKRRNGKRVPVRGEDGRAHSAPRDGRRRTALEAFGRTRRTRSTESSRWRTQRSPRKRSSPAWDRRRPTALVFSLWRVPERCRVRGVQLLPWDALVAKRARPDLETGSRVWARCASPKSRRRVACAAPRGSRSLAHGSTAS